MIYSVKKTNQFKKDCELCIKRGLPIEDLDKVLLLLAKGETLPQEYLDHPLQPSKDYKNCRELHIKPNWLLIYKYYDDEVILYLIRTGTHSDLF